MPILSGGLSKAFFKGSDFITEGCSIHPIGVKHRYHKIQLNILMGK